jgi:hypothetical protein
MHTHTHSAQVCFGNDGDYIVYCSWDCFEGWVEHTRWLIPGTEF